MTILDELERRPPQQWIARGALDRGAALVAAGGLSRPRVGARRAVVDVREPRMGRVRAEIQCGTLGPVTSCGCGMRQPCAHVAALALLLVGAARREAAGDDGSEDAPISLEERERQTRRERGRSGLFKVAPRADRAPGAFVVGSPSGRRYEVVLRSLQLPHNGCTCEDFATNRLGTCKHIEAALEWIRAPRRRSSLAAAPHTYLFVAHAATAEVHLCPAPRVGRQVDQLSARWFDSSGRLTIPLDAAWPELSSAAELAGVEVPAEVRALAARQLEAGARGRRRDDLEAEIRRAGRDQPGFRGRLYPYQVDGVAFLVSRGRALLADDMGLGKTAQTIAAMVRLFRSGAVQRTLIVCPASLKHQWADELQRFVGLPGLRVSVVSGPRQARHAVYRSPGEIVITSYELLRSDEREVARLAPDLLVLDEAQRIKNWRTRTADAVKRVKSPYAFVLTGTPLENRLDDLYSLMQVVDPHVLGPLWCFNRDFVTTDDRGRASGYHNLAELRSRLASSLLRRRKEEVLDQLPERLTSRLELPMDDDQRGFHAEAEESVGRLLSILKRRPLSPIEEQRLMRGFQRMRMACDAAALCGAASVTSPKLVELERLLDEICIDGGHKVVVFTEWTRMQALAAGVARRLGIGHVRLHGGVPSQQRGGLIERFRKDPACRIFFSTDAGGVGLNLQDASFVINVDLPWNPAVLAQRIARVHRLGQKRAVNVVLLLAEASIETRMEGTLASKRQLFEAAVGDNDETVALERTSLARRLTTLLGDSFAATTGPAAEASAPALVAQAHGVVEVVAKLRTNLGSALHRVLRLGDGRIVAIVAETTAPGPGVADALVITASAAAGLAAFGDTSPLAGADELFSSVASSSPDATRRTHSLATAERKLAAARTLLAGGQPSEALALVHAALTWACRAACESDPGEDAAALLVAVYGELLSRRVLTPADAHALARAGELARAFVTSPVGPPADLVTVLLDEATQLAMRLRERPDPAVSARAKARPLPASPPN